ncbi:hypothetical protein D6D26_10283 [Aureobasidium pullulans]|nr:hypothetical protein D6D26_10283 [Aureobasidium pullulans]
MPLDDYSAKAFNRLVRYRYVLDAFITVRASPRERARFLRYLNAAEYDPNSRVGNVRLYKDANKVKRSPLAIATFYKEPTVAAAPNDSNDNEDNATNATAYRRNDSESSLDSEGNDAPGPNSAASGPNSATSAVAITAASS